MKGSTLDQKGRFYHMHLYQHSERARASAMPNRTQKQNPGCSAGSADRNPIKLTVPPPNPPPSLAGVFPLQLRLLSSIVETPPRPFVRRFRGEAASRALATMRRRAADRAVLRLFLRRGYVGVGSGNPPAPGRCRGRSPAAFTERRPLRRCREPCDAESKSGPFSGSLTGVVTSGGPVTP